LNNLKKEQKPMKGFVIDTDLSDIDRYRPVRYRYNITYR